MIGESEEGKNLAKICNRRVKTGRQKKDKLEELKANKVS